MRRVIGPAKLISKVFGLVLLAAYSPAAGADTLRIVTHILPPYTMHAGSRATGLAVDIVQDIMQRTGNSGTPEVEPFPRVLQDVKTGPDTLGFIIARTPERESLMQWLGPIVVDGVYFYKRAGAPLAIATLQEAKALARIGVTRGDADDAFLTEQHFTNLDRSESQSLDLRKVALGRVDVTPMSQLVFATAAVAAGLKLTDFERTPVKLYDSRVYMAFSPDVPARVVRACAAALAAIKASGAFEAILIRFGVDPQSARASADDR